MNFLECYRKISITEGKRELNTFLSPMLTLMDNGFPGNRELPYIVARPDYSFKTIMALSKYLNGSNPRADVIMWCARWFRIYAIAGYIKRYQNVVDPKALQALTRMLDTDIAKFAANGTSHSLDQMVFLAGILYSNDNTNNIWEMLSSEHSSFNPDEQTYAPVFGKYRFTYQTPLQVVKDFDEINNRVMAKTHELNKRFITQDQADEDGAKLIIPLPNNFGWYSLNVSCSDVEGDAMNHCGNSDTFDVNDHILSLRQTVDNNGDTVFVPYLTFIIDSQGYLGEMKGRHNQRPTPDFYPYIVPLLKSKYVNGIIGAGFKPEANFQIQDLPTDVYEDLIREKPELVPVFDRIITDINDGKTKDATALLNRVMTGMEYPPATTIFKNGTVVLGAMPVSKYPNPVVAAMGDRIAGKQVSDNNLASIMSQYPEFLDTLNEAFDGSVEELSPENWSKLCAEFYQILKKNYIGSDEYEEALGYTRSTISEILPASNFIDIDLDMDIIKGNAVFMLVIDADKLSNLYYEAHKARSGINHEYDDEDDDDHLKFDYNLASLVNEQSWFYKGIDPDTSLLDDYLVEEYPLMYLLYNNFDSYYRNDIETALENFLGDVMVTNDVADDITELLSRFDEMNEMTQVKNMAGLQ